MVFLLKNKRMKEIEAVDKLGATVVLKHGTEIFFKDKEYKLPMAHLQWLQVVWVIH